MKKIIITIVAATACFACASNIQAQNIQPPQYQERWSNGEWGRVFMHKNFVYNQALGKWVYAPEYTAGVIRVNHNTNGARLNWENFYIRPFKENENQKLTIKPKRTAKEKEILDNQGEKALVEYINKNLTR